MRMRMTAACLSLPSTCLCLNCMPLLDRLSRHTCDPAHDPVPPHRPCGRWQPTHRSDLWLRRRSHSAASPLHMLLLRQLNQTVGCRFQRQKSAPFPLSLDNIFCLHLFVITAHERLVWLCFDVPVVESLAEVIPLLWVFLIISGIVCIVTGGDNQKEILRLLHLIYHNFSVPHPLG